MAQTSSASSNAAPSSNEAPRRDTVAALTLGAIGVVYGDIGTSPLYTVKEIFALATGVGLNPDNLIGAVSAIVWALTLVVTLKYVCLILRADNRGEGGGLALTALAAEAVKSRPALRRALLLMGVFGATLFYGDSVITPAISVLGAMEGIELVTPALKPFVVPQALLHNLKHKQVLHERNIVLTVVFAEKPSIPEDRCMVVEPLVPGFWRVTLHFGFMDTPDVPKALVLAKAQGLPVPAFETSYFLSRETVVPTPGGGMVNWRERLFATMSRNADDIADDFRLPGNSVVEIGTRVQI